MKKLLLILVSILAVVMTGCSIGGWSTGSIADLTQPTTWVNTNEQNNQEATRTQDSQKSAEKDSQKLAQEEQEQQKQQQNTPEEFDPNSYNDQEINELIAMLEWLVEVEQQYE